MAARSTNVPDPYDPQAFRTIVADYDRRLDSLERVIGTYQVSNFTRVTTLNMGTATATDIGNFLCTLVQDMQKAKRWGG